MAKSKTKSKTTTKPKKKLPLQVRVNEAERNFTTLWNNAFKATQSQPADMARVFELHPSSFPYCPLRHLLQESVEGISDVYEMPLGMNFYVSIGTVVHEIFQDYIGKAHLFNKKKQDFYMVGDWKCTNPKCEHLHAFCKKPEACEKCGCEDTLYEELSIKLGKNIVGHVDGLFYSNGSYFVIDYKTTSSFAVFRHNKDGNVFPYGYNVAQIKTYVVALEILFDIEISGYSLVYITRDAPNKMVPTWTGVSDKEKVKIRKTLNRYDKGFGYARKILAKKNMLKAKTLIDKVIKYKSCKDKTFYMKEVRNKYEPCPWGESGLCWKANKMKPIIRQHLGEQEPHEVYLKYVGT